ncbi:MAG: T9SS type A sorting domain-containing protein [Ginsengibacter sp.]
MTAGSTSLVLSPSGVPYVVYADEANRKKASVKKFENGLWQFVGAAGVSDSVADYTDIAIAPDGTPYIAYSDWSRIYKTTVKKFDGIAWVTVGTERFTGNVDADLLKMIVAPDGSPYIAYGDPDISNTTLTFGKKAVVMKFNGTAWVNAADEVSAGEAADVSLILTKDGSRLLIAYNGGGSYIKSLLISGALPVRLTNFSAVVNAQSNASLQWKVAGQLNITRYEIERKLDGIHYTTVGVVDANTLNEFTYQFTDRQAFTGVGFYRLKIIDQDGSFTYSNVVRLQLSPKSTVSLYPVPASESITIQTANEQYKNTSLTITDNSGRIVLKQLLQSNRQSINISRLANGIYYVTFIDGTIRKFQKIK